MTPRLDSVISHVLRQQQGPLEVHDEQGMREYVIVAKDTYRHLIEHEFRQWLQVGLDQETAGQAGPWSLDDVLAEAHRRDDGRKVN
jgi:hypothetical protein